MAKVSRESIYAEVVLRSQTGASLITDAPRVTANNLYMYQSVAESSAEVSQKLKQVGFTVIAASQFGVSIVGPEKLYNEFFKAKIVERPVQMFFGGMKRYAAPAFFMDDPPRLPNDMANLAESLYIPLRGWFLAGEGAMPTPTYYALKPPADISRLTKAEHAHSRGIRGTGIKVAMVDSGFILNHDYYASRGYHITVDAAVGSTTQDEYGHGTGIASNLLAIAPECDFHFVKMSDGFQWASLAAFRMAVQAGAKIISNSWGQGRDTILEAEIVAAVAVGVTVIFACGNGGPVGWPGCMLEVISVGGAFPRQDGTWEASSYASSGVNSIYPTRHCPDVSAIVGQAPKGILIVMPTMIEAIFDDAFGGGTFPNGDETAINDGWLVASGTSSAAPMVAGAAALLLEAKPSLTPAEIKQTLADTCVDVIQGASASGEIAGVGPDSATGAGMINIGAAVDKVKPYIACFTAPLIPCKAPIIQCRLAPIEQCRVAPIIQCRVAPIEQCRLAPIFQCRVAPSLVQCPPSPVVGCLAGPWKSPIDPGEGVTRRSSTGQMRQQISRRRVPVVIMVDEEELALWGANAESSASLRREEAHRIALQKAQKTYDAVLRELGMSDEYEGFPDYDECQRGPFNPTVDE